MKSRPILFSGSMVRAVLDGSKTQTRRVGKIQSQDFVGLKAEAVRHATLGYQIQATYDAYPGRGTARHAICACPFGQPGDQLWVRETFAEEYSFCDHPEMPGAPTEHFHFAWHYRADGESAKGDLEGFLSTWKPSIHMPRAASRITLEITGVRVERLQNISEADALAEGVSDTGAKILDSAANEVTGPIAEYSVLWESINGPGSWDLNQWVWVVEFRRLS